MLTNEDWYFIWQIQKKCQFVHHHCVASETCQVSYLMRTRGKTAQSMKMTTHLHLQSITQEKMPVSVRESPASKKPVATRPCLYEFRQYTNMQSDVSF